MVTISIVLNYNCCTKNGKPLPLFLKIYSDFYSDMILFRTLFEI